MLSFRDKFKIGGYYLATILATRHASGFIPIRKAKKLPSADIAPVITAEYGTEYSQDSIGIITDADYKDKTVLVIDDLVATGGSLEAADRLLTEAGMEVLGSAVVYCVEPLLETAKARVPNLSVLLSG